MKVSFLLGAGFSIPAGYPSGKRLNEKFFGEVVNNIIRQSSSEWQWDEHASHNGRLSTETLTYSYLIEVLIEEYQRRTYKPFDYEDFYSWFYEHKNDSDLIKTQCEIVNRRLIEEHDLNEGDWSLFNLDEGEIATVKNRIDEIYNYLVADLLSSPNPKNKESYNEFLKYVSEEEYEVNIFSLNHDKLVESLLNDNSIEYSDGFSRENTVLIGEGGNQLNIFQDNYQARVNLIKLHGSIGYLKYEEGIEDFALLRRTGKYWFYKADSSEDKNFPKRINLDTGKVVQKLPNHTILPQFLTGAKKGEIVKNHFYYTPVFKRFENSFEDLDLLIVIGYSFSDSHINEILKEGVDNYSFRVIHVNPDLSFPFKRNFSKDFVEEKCDITEL